MDDDADAKMILTAFPPDNWYSPRFTWLNTIQHDLRVYNLYKKTKKKFNSITDTNKPPCARKISIVQQQCYEFEPYSQTV